MTDADIGQLVGLIDEQCRVSRDRTRSCAREDTEVLPYEVGIGLCGMIIRYLALSPCEVGTLSPVV